MDSDSLKVHFDQHTAIDFKSSTTPIIRDITLFDNILLKVRFLKKLSIRNILLLKIHSTRKTVLKYLDESSVKTKYIFKHNIPLNIYQMLYKTNLKSPNKQSTLLIEFIIKPSDIREIGSIKEYRKLPSTEKLKYLYNNSATEEITIDLSTCDLKHETQYGISIECFDFELQMQYVSELDKFIHLNSSTDNDSIVSSETARYYELTNKSTYKPYNSVQTESSTVENTTLTTVESMSENESFIDTVTTEESEKEEIMKEENEVASVDTTPEVKMMEEKVNKEEEKENIKKEEKVNKETNTNITDKETNNITDKPCAPVKLNNAYNDTTGKLRHNLVVELKNELKKVPKSEEIQQPMEIKKQMYTHPELNNSFTKMCKKIGHEKNITEDKNSKQVENIEKDVTEVITNNTNDITTDDECMSNSSIMTEESNKKNTSRKDIYSKNIPRSALGFNRNRNSPRPGERKRVVWYSQQTKWELFKEKMHRMYDISLDVLTVVLVGYMIALLFSSTVREKTADAIDMCIERYNSSNVNKNISKIDRVVDKKEEILKKEQERIFKEKLLKEKMLKEEQERLLKEKLLKEEQERLLKEKKEKEKLLKEEQERMLLLKQEEISKYNTYNNYLTTLLTNAGYATIGALLVIGYINKMNQRIDRRTTYYE